MSILWPGGGKGGRSPLGCPDTFSFSMRSLTCTDKTPSRAGLTSHKFQLANLTVMSLHHRSEQNAASVMTDANMENN